MMYRLLKPKPITYLSNLMPDAFTPQFKRGDRVTDPMLTDIDDRYRVNANIDPEIAILIKQVCLNRGAMQLITAAFFKHFHTQLLANHVRTNIDLDTFHLVLAECTGQFVPELTINELGIPYTVCGNAVQQVDGAESGRNVGDGPASVRTKNAGTKKGTANAASDHQPGGRSNGGKGRKGQKGKGE